MKYFGGLLLLAYAGIHTFGYDRFADDDRGRLPPGIRSAPGGILLWHSGFMGGK